MKRHIDENMNIKDILEKFPGTLDIFENNGFNGLKDPKVLEILSTVTLKKAMELKKMDTASFIVLLDEAISSMDSVEKKDGGVSILGLLPCPVRTPLLENFQNFLSENPDIQANYQLKAASSGLGWIKEEVIQANNIDKLADMFISAGFDLFFEKELMGKFKAQGIFKDITDMEHYNSDFENASISLKDPHGDYSMIGVVPAIFLVNRETLGDREIPTSWKDILSPKFEKSISLPIADFDLFNAILVNIYKNYGDEGVKALGRNLMESMHPAQMVGSSGPAVTIMPFFFSKMIQPNSPMVPVWPEDGAIISPIFMLTKKEKEKELKKLAQFMGGKEVGNILANQGLFPSVNPQVKNPTTGKPFMWVGWDFIYNNDMGKIIRHCENIFFSEVNR